ncbi:PP2C family protein-serine/threonine phosphatase [Streptacidiphilus sp. N1-12]|uniref:PP2C family protein-serine/threonine phosphatase n=2 Tax=Streptacidiphilus alkalitolerans TaxID=3342712 RepID=A0ABV6VIP1_9ACTN
MRDRLSPRNLTRGALCLLMVAGALVDLLTPGDQRFDLFLSAAPALAASIGSVRGTAAIGVLALLIEGGVAFTRDPALRSTSWAGMAVIAVVTVAACYTSKVRAQYEQDLSEVREVAETAQRMILRPLPSSLGAMELHLLYAAAAAQARIGGDFYEVLRAPGSVRVILGDVQGKGLPAVEVASVLLTAFRTAGNDAADLPALVDALEQGLARYSEQVPDSDAAERFATVVLVEIPDDLPVVRILNCGHPSPLLIRRGQRIRTLDPAVYGLPVNLTLLGGQEGRRVDVSPFEADDRLLLFTDGVSETRDRDGVFYPLTERLQQWTAQPCAALLERLRVDLRAFGAAPRDDDMAALIVHRRAVAAGLSPPAR